MQDATDRPVPDYLVCEVCECDAEMYTDTRNHTECVNCGAVPCPGCGEHHVPARPRDPHCPDCEDALREDAWEARREAMREER